MMMNIGDFARLGGVSARMLRHYDAIGLLPPAQIEPHSGRRSYQLEQLAALNRIIALKTLGFTLEQIGSWLADPGEERKIADLLIQREAELAGQLRRDQHVLNRLRARLRLIEAAGPEPTIRELTSQRLVGLSAVAGDASRERTGPVSKALFERVAGLMDRAGADRTTPIARYSPLPGSTEQVRISAGYLLATGQVPGLEVLVLPAVTVASLVLQGPPAELGAGYQRLAGWAAISHGTDPAAGIWRENFLEARGDAEADWIIELQLEL